MNDDKPTDKPVAPVDKKRDPFKDIVIPILGGLVGVGIIIVLIGLIGFGLIMFTCSR